jgi:hypothetical protein
MADLAGFVYDLGGFRVRARLDLIDERRGGADLGNDCGLPHSVAPRPGAVAPAAYTRGC